MRLYWAETQMGSRRVADKGRIPGCIQGQACPERAQSCRGGISPSGPRAYPSHSEARPRIGEDTLVWPSKPRIDVIRTGHVTEAAMPAIPPWSRGRCNTYRSRHRPAVTWSGSSLYCDDAIPFLHPGRKPPHAGRGPGGCCGSCHGHPGREKTGISRAWWAEEGQGLDVGSQRLGEAG